MYKSVKCLLLQIFFVDALVVLYVAFVVSLFRPYLVFFGAKGRLCFGTGLCTYMLVIFVERSSLIKENGCA